MGPRQNHRHKPNNDSLSNNSSVKEIGSYATVDEHQNRILQHERDAGPSHVNVSCGSDVKPAMQSQAYDIQPMTPYFQMGNPYPQYISMYPIDGSGVDQQSMFMAPVQYSAYPSTGPGECYEGYFLIAIFPI